MVQPSPRYCYRIYGLILTANRPLPGLTSWDDSGDSILIHVHELFPQVYLDTEWQGHPDYISHREFDHGQAPKLNILQSRNAQLIRFDYHNGLSFIINPKELTIEIASRYNSADDFFPYLIGPILGFILRLKGIVALHASAIRINTTCLAISGISGAGKSTTASAFIKQGYFALSDDVTPVVYRGESWEVLPGYPSLRLWEDTATLAHRNAETLQPIVAGLKKYYLPIENQFQSQECPLRAIFVLNERNSTVESPTIRLLSQGDALLTLVAHTYVNYLISPVMRAQEFKLLGNLVKLIPVFAVGVPHDLTRLPMLRDAILGSFLSLP